MLDVWKRQSISRFLIAREVILKQWKFEGVCFRWPHFAWQNNIFMHFRLLTFTTTRDFREPIDVIDRAKTAPDIGMLGAQVSRDG